MSRAPQFVGGKLGPEEYSEERVRILHW